MSLDRTIDGVLRDLGTPERAEQEKRYLKSELTHYGAPVPAMRRAVKESLAEAGELTRVELLRAVVALWSQPVYERRWAAVDVLVQRVKLLDAQDLALVERLVRESKTWALVDTLSVHVAGPLVTRFPTLNDTLDRWATDEDFWVRRAAMLSLLLALRKGGGDFDRFGRYADAMLHEREFFIRKAIGWILREVARKRPAIVTAWLLPRVKRASGLTFREATRSLPEAQRAKLTRAREGAAAKRDRAAPVS